MPKKKTIYDEYFSYQNKYEEKYKSNKVIVLMEVGKFYEIYGIKDREGKVEEVCDVLSIRISNKDSVKGDKYYLFAGFPNWSCDKFIQILLDNKYIVVLVDQTKTGSIVNRAVSNILTPSINLDYIKDKENNYILCAYLEESKCVLTNGKKIYCGLSYIDITTGNNYLHEFGTNVNDNNMCLDEISRFIHTFSPNEIIIYDKTTIGKHEIYSYLQLHQYNSKYYDFDNEENSIYLDENYKKITLEKIFQKKNVIDIYEYLDINHCLNFSITSYIMLLNYIYKYNELASRLSVKRRRYIY